MKIWLIRSYESTGVFWDILRSLPREECILKTIVQLCHPNFRNGRKNERMNESVVDISNMFMTKIKYISRTLKGQILISNCESPYLIDIKDNTRVYIILRNKELEPALSFLNIVRLRLLRVPYETMFAFTACILMKSSKQILKPFRCSDIA